MSRERNPETDSWMWLFRSGEDGLPADPALSLHRDKGKVPCSIFPAGVPWISGDRRTPAGYNDLPDIKRCSCWAHVRRYFTV